MPVTLKHSLSSDYLDAARLMSPKRKRRRIVAYVESYDDIAFWRSALSEFENEECYFQVMLPVADKLTHGKKTVLMSSLDDSQFGKNLIACVDSDYDFLLQDTTEQSRKMNGNPYIFQTYCYAIENYQCYAESLHDACVAATLNDRDIFDFPSFFKEYSKIVYPLFIWNIFFYRRKDTRTFPMGKFNEVTGLRNVDIRNPQRCLNQLKGAVNAKLFSLSEKYENLRPYVDQLADELKQLGVIPETTYLYMQGHHVFDNVVMKVLIPVCTQLRRELEDRIKKMAVHATQMNNELIGYENSSVPIETMLRKSDNYKDLFLYEWLRDDLRKFVQGLS